MIEVLVLNTGSSSIKYQLFDMSTHSTLATGLLEGVGEPSSRLTHRSTDRDPLVVEQHVGDHTEGFAWIETAFQRTDGLPQRLVGIGHRVVHGGSRFWSPALIDADVVAAIEEQIPLAPLHNPSNLVGIEIARGLFPDVPQVAVFDTAFHATMPPRAYRYALPVEFADRLGLRRYGFHGTSHAHVSRRAAALLGRQTGDVNLITLHLGNGASVAAIERGRCVDTSMGMTPLEGLVMGTRSGDIDPGVVLHLLRHERMTVEEVDSLLNRQSGLKGLTGVRDVRDIGRRADAGDRAAAEALELYAYRIRKYVGAYAAALGRVDALVFTAGVGQNSARVRADVCSGLEAFGIRLDTARNEAPSDEPRRISADGSEIAVLVVPTDEELEIAEQTVAVVTGPTGG